MSTVGVAGFKNSLNVKNKILCEISNSNKMIESYEFSWNNV